MYFLAFDFGILLSLNIIFYIILGLAILSGFVKGFKKSLFNFITMAIFYVVFFVTLNMVVGILWEVDLSFLGGLLSNINSDLSGFTSFKDSYLNVMQVFLGEEVDLSAMSSEFMDLAMGITMFILKIVWTVLYFTVILVVYKFIMFLIRLIFVKNKEGQNKRRGLGAIVGALNGLMAIFIALIVMGGMISIVGSMSTLASELLTDEPQTLNFQPRQNIYQASYSLLAEEADPDTSQLNDAIDLMDQMVEEYNSNLFVSLANRIEVASVIDEDVMVPMHINLFDSVLSFDYNDNTIAFRYELMVFADAFLIFSESEYQNTQEISDITGEEIRDIFETISSSKLVVSVVPLAIEYAALRFEQDLPIPVEELYDGTIDFEEELATLGRIGGALFDILNGAGFIGDEGSLDQIEITGDSVRDLFDDISNSDIMLLITETLLLPMLADSEGDISLIIEVPSDLDLELEFLALGEIFAEIVEAEIDFNDILGDDITTTLSTLSQIDLTVLLDSRLVSTALINILSGEAGIEGLEMLSIPAGINWEDQGSVEGELRKILEALNILLDLSSGLDLENLDLQDILDMSSADIAVFFDSYVIRATVTDFVKEMDMGTMPLVFPDSIYDDQDYFTKEELVAVIEAIKLIIDEAAADLSFEPTKVLELTETDIDTLLTSEIIHATIGNYINTIDTSDFIIPDSVNSSVQVGGIAKDVISKTELKAMFSALNVLQITDFDNVTFDASFLDNLENTAGDDVDQAKVNQLLESLIIHATLSNTVIDLDESNGGVLIVPNSDVLNNPIINQVSSINYLDEDEVYAIFRALYHLDITDFNTIDLDDTTKLLDNMTYLLNSAILHATVSDTILDIGSAVLVPTKDVDNNDVIKTVGTTTYIVKTELEALVDGLDLLGVTNPNSFSNFTFANLDTDTKRNTLLASAILHATISKQLLDLNDDLLFVPNQDEDGTAVIIQRGTEPIDYVSKAEVKALIDAMLSMGYSDVNDLSVAIDPQGFIDQMAKVLVSASLQATVSNLLLAPSVTSIIIPDEDLSTNDIRIVFSDVTFIESTELEKFFTSIDLFQITDLDFDSFDVSPDDIQATDMNILFDSFIMQATVSEFFLDIAGDETATAGTTTLLIPTTKRQAITVEAVNSEVVEKTELINMVAGFDTLGLSGYGASFDANAITALTATQIDDLLLSDSIHITIDSMLKGNAAIAGSVPVLATDSTTYSVDVTTKTEIKNFLLATQQFAGVNFTNVTFNIASVTGLNQTQRDIVLESMIVRNILTDEIETNPLYTPDANNYEENNLAYFLTVAGIKTVLSIS